MVSDLRLKRLEGVIKKKVAEMLVTELRDPRIGFVTLTRVKLARDLSHATILWSILGGDGDRSKTQHALDDARGYIQSAVAKVMATRVTPRLSFQFDSSIEKGDKVLSILRDLRHERGETEDDEDGGGEADDHDDGEEE